MKKLWQKNWQLNKIVEEFETTHDILLDNKLVVADVLGSLAHVAGLMKIGILTKAEFAKIKQGLKAILKKYHNGEFVVESGDEDVHTKIENYVTKQYGTAGKKIHTGRSRNDQVLTALRLYTREQTLEICLSALDLSEAFLVFAKKNKNVPLPGYTHMQKAMPTTLGAWSAALASGVHDSVEQILATLVLINRSPLGSGAGYGVPLPLPCVYTAKLLGFDGVQENVNAVQNSRGKLEALLVAGLVALLSDINKFATDVLLFTTTEFNYFSVAPELCSGSSLMPQKKNVDVAELLRSKVHLVAAQYQAIVGVSSNLPLGYNRDVQDTKQPFFAALSIAKASLPVTKLLIENITPQEKILQQAMTKELFATERALTLVQQGVPFRDAYLQAAKENAAGTLPVAKKKVIDDGITTISIRQKKISKKIIMLVAKFKRVENSLLKY